MLIPKRLSRDPCGAARRCASRLRRRCSSMCSNKLTLRLLYLVNGQIYSAKVYFRGAGAQYAPLHARNTRPIIMGDQDSRPSPLSSPVQRTTARLYYYVVPLPPTLPLLLSLSLLLLLLLELLELESSLLLLLKLLYS